MRKLARNMILFLLPLMLLLVLMPLDKRQQYIGLKDDCFDHGLWIHDRICENPLEVDIAFLGSSHAINGFNDGLISDSLAPLVAANFGYCRLGRNLHYAILKDLVKNKNLKTLIVEVREQEDRYSHPVFPFVASSMDVMLPNPFFNRDIAIDMWNHLGYKVELYQTMFYGEEEDPALRMEKYGYAYHADTASSEFLDRIKIERSRPRYKAKGFEAWFHNNFARVYLKKIAGICKKNDIKLYFLYFPSYASPSDEPEAYSIYNKYGVVLIPPKSIYEDQHNWYDENHLNRTGATQLSLWFIETMKDTAGLSSR